MNLPFTAEQFFDVFRRYNESVWPAQLALNAIALITAHQELENLTGNGVSLNTSLNRRGEPMICSPTDALNMFYGSDLRYLIMEDILVVKEGMDWYDSVS